MKLPLSVQTCLATLEQAGFATYAVGGCVRDHLLGLQPQDYDLCSAATPAQIKQLFAHHGLVLAGEKHGTVGVIFPDGVVEITTFRTEAGYRDNRHPDRVEFVTSIEADLARRDFTVNAMAFSPSKGLCDPFGGAEDLKNGILRAVGDPFTRFREDSLRILRGVRFAVLYGLAPQAQTLQAMIQLAPLMDNLARERVFSELCKLLPLVSAQHLQLYAPILTQVIPELQPCIGFDQHSAHHAYDVYTHICCVTEATGPNLALRWAALLHDVGKPAVFSLDEAGQGHFYGHARRSAELADAILRRLKAPTALREQVVFLIDKHMTPITADRKLLRRQLSRWGEENLALLLQLQRADFCAKGVIGEQPNYAAICALLERIRSENACLTQKDLAVNGNDLKALGLSGKAIGQALSFLLEQVLDEKIPNEKTALLNALQQH